MSGSPLKNLVELIPHDVILQELESGVKALPTVAKCPVNPEHKFMLHPDGASIWGSCEQCGFSGDSIDILKVKFQDASIEGVIGKLERAGKLTDVPRDLMADYQTSKIKRETWAHFLADAKIKLVTDGFDVRVLNACGAPPPFKREWHEGFGQFVGVADKVGLSSLLGASMTKVSRDTLMLPYYDFPGRLATIRLVSHNSRGLTYIDKPTNRSGGLFMLGSVTPCSEYVIAVEDPIFACRLQMRQMEQSLTTLPVVAWHPDTKYWPISPKRTVFWAPVPSVAVFSQARKLADAFICTPRNTLDFDAIIQERSIKNWVHHVMLESKPWAMALKETLLGLDIEAAIRFARELEITPLETGELLFECTVAEKALLSDILDLRASVRTVIAGDSKVVERDNAWWTHTEKGRASRVTNAPFVIDKSAHCESRGSYLLGIVNVDGRSERFMAPAEEFMNQPTKWLRKFALKKGMGIVQTLMGWDHRLMDISFQFHTEKVEHTELKAVVGWSDSLDRFVFPNVTLVNGRVDECALGLPMDEMPCTKVTSHSTPKSVWDSFTQDTKVNRAFWAVMANIGMTMGAKLTDTQPRKVGIIGPQRNLSLISTALNLHCTQLSGSTKVATRVMPYVMHDVPVCLQPTSNFKVFMDWLESSGVHNVMVGLNHSQAAMIGGQDWVFVDTREMNGAIQHLHSGTNLLADLVRVWQSLRKDEIPTSPSHMLDLIYTWATLNKPWCERTVFDGAAELITEQSIYGSIGNCEAFLYSLYAMIMEDRVTVSRSMMSKKVGEVDISEKHIKVSKSLLHKMAMPVSLLELTKDLESFGYLMRSTPSEWILKRDKWDEQYEHWTSIRGA